MLKMHNTIRIAAMLALLLAGAALRAQTTASGTINATLNSTGYTLTAALQGGTPKGFTFAIDAITLTGAAQTIQANGSYNTDVPHNLDLIISTASPTAGGPNTGTLTSQTINFTATAN